MNTLQKVKKFVEELEAKTLSEAQQSVLVEGEDSMWAGDNQTCTNTSNKCGTLSNITCTNTELCACPIVNQCINYCTVPVPGK